MDPKTDNADVTGAEPLVCQVQKETVGIILDEVRWATWEACARAYGHTNEVEMLRKFREWDSNGAD